MNTRTDHHDDDPVIIDLREELGEELLRAADGRSVSVRARLTGRRLAGLAAGLLLVPASLAVASRLDDEDHTLTWDGENVYIDGEQVECPSDPALQRELRMDPCQILSPAPAPRFGREAGAEDDGARKEPNVRISRATLRDLSYRHDTRRRSRGRD